MRHLRSATTLVVLAILLATGGAVAAAESHRRDAELDELTARAVVLAELLSSYARELESALVTTGAIAAVVGSDPARFVAEVEPRLDRSVLGNLTLVRVGGESAEPLASVGEGRPLLLGGLERVELERLRRIATGERPGVVKLATVGGIRVLAIAAAGGDGTAVYAESPISMLATAFPAAQPEGIDFALFLGQGTAPASLLVASTEELPLDGPLVTRAVDLASAPATLALRPRGSLIGGLSGSLPWLVAATGVVLAAVAGLILELRRRRARADEERRQLAEQNERLREIDRMKDELVAVASHELRTPLTSILGYVRVLREEGDELTVEHRRFLGVIERNARRLLDLVSDLLFVARVDAGGIRLELERIDLAAIVRDCLETHRQRAQTGGLTLSFASDGGVPAVDGDPGRLAQLVENLVANAIKFTPGGGRVEVRLSGTGRGGVALEVEDTGLGVPADEQERLFERFFRSSTARTAAIQGTGLGLAIAKAIVDAHGGRISFASEEGVGTVFRVELPAARAEPLALAS
ncbi:MAG: hypothetical protein IT201_10505 [Thermoleophilia bacterium]|nr:hypothetical protein [Thermoleophilia bacterium]